MKKANYLNSHKILKAEETQIKLKKLVSNPLTLPIEQNDICNITLLNNDVNMEVGSYYIFDITFDEVCLTPTDITLNLSIDKKTIIKSEYNNELSTEVALDSE